ncbi:hypothetical protein [Vibrio splendidus]|uniref:hypothetical protein n=1 Tax=Vibrio splendidus TaxID=29497 RepID=UPI003D0C204B
MKATISLTGYARISFANKVWTLLETKLVTTHLFSVNEAKNELAKLKVSFESKGLYLKPEELTKTDFFKYSRIGLTKPIDRRERFSIYLTFENCLKHISISTLRALEA